MHTNSYKMSDQNANIVQCPASDSDLQRTPRKECKSPETVPTALHHLQRLAAQGHSQPEVAPLYWFWVNVSPRSLPVSTHIKLQHLEHPEGIISTHI